VKCWRTTLNHRKAQQEGRAGIFRNYRLRIAAVVRDYGMLERTEAPDAYHVS
jgi:heme-degrading monooxygenase HmoA